jgi:hypothetical protein
MEHTKLPWKISEDENDDVFGICAMFADESAEANAEFIVRACNSHYELLEALKEAEEHSRRRLPVKKAMFKYPCTDCKDKEQFGAKCVLESRCYAYMEYLRNRVLLRKRRI